MGTEVSKSSSIIIVLVPALVGFYPVAQREFIILILIYKVLVDHYHFHNIDDMDIVLILLVLSQYILSVLRIKLLDKFPNEFLVIL